MTGRRPLNSWHLHPGVRSGDRLTLGERSADVVRNGMGSWPFVFAFLMLMGAWAWANGSDGFDPFPYILLNLMLSLMAGLQGAILLISAKRSDSISSEVAAHTLKNTNQLRDLIEANTALTASIESLSKQIHAHVCVGDTTEPPARTEDSRQKR